VSLEKATNPVNLHAELTRRNWSLARNPLRAKPTLEKICGRPPQAYWLHAVNLGWRPDDQAFVFQDRIVGAEGGRTLLKPPLWIQYKARFHTSQAGTLEGWINDVARPCRRSTRLMLLLSASLAAALLKPLGFQSFGINLHGPSKTGKSTALIVAGSVIGISREGQLPNFNATDASLFEVARLCNDLPMPLNEAGLIDGHKRDAYATFRTLIYTLAEGQDRGRHSASSYASDPHETAFRMIFMPNSERSITELAKASGQVRDHGEYARCWDIPAVAHHCKTIFDLLPTDVPRRVATRRARSRLHELRDAAQLHHGHAMQAFVEHLLANQATFREEAATWIERFVRRTHLPSSEGAALHAARNFGLAYAAGRLAIRAGLFPWSDEELLRAILTCFQDGYALVRPEQPLEKRAKQILQEHLNKVSLPEKGKSALDPAQTIGFQRQEGERTVITIHSKTFRAWFQDQAHLLAALGWLQRRGLLKTGGKDGRRGKGYEWAVTTPRWGERKVKSIVFHLPR